MVDKVKAYKEENSATGGTENDLNPTEVNPAEDYLAAKGLAFENLDTFRVEKLGRTIQSLYPDSTIAVTYSSGDPSSISFFNSATQIDANRIAKCDLVLSSGDPSTETWLIYDTDGTTVLRTITYTYTVSSNVITGVARAVT